MRRLFKLIPVFFLVFVLAGTVLLGGCEKNNLAVQASALPCKIITSYPHDPHAYTQGMAIDNGVMYEGTGIYGKSSLRRVDLQSGKVLQLHKLPSQLFGEGVTVFGNKIIQLTWKAHGNF
jgi:glutamine cyclotransferase